MPYQIPQNIRTILEPLAEAVFPVGAWVAQRTPPRYDQFIAPIGSVPWRTSGAPPALSTNNFEVIKFLELLVDSDAANEALAPRWRQIKANPGSFFKTRSGQSMAEWRASRKGLEPSAIFAPFAPDSNNFAFWVVAPDGKTRDPVSRKQFYDACWSPLDAVYQSAQPGNADQWGDFSRKLWASQFPAEWPSTNAVSSANFITQFTLDVLTACMGQRNMAITASDPLWQRAVLIEAGENRHPNYAYSVKEADTAVQTFVKTI
jgi:hypothetical protein